MSDLVDDAGKHVEAYQKTCEDAVTKRPVDNNDTGICGVCQEPISLVRLQFSPHAENCLECQAEIEYLKLQAKRF